MLENPAVLAPWAVNHFRAPAASLLEILQYGGPGLFWGGSYLAALGAPIPFVSRLFAEVAFNPVSWRIEHFWPAMLITGGTPGFSPVTEGYINFGIMGIIIHLYLYGYAIGRVYNHASSRQTLPAMLLLAGSLPVFVLDGLCVSSASFVYKWTRGYLMPWLIFWGLEMLAPRRARRPVKAKTR